MVNMAPLHLKAFRASNLSLIPALKLETLQKLSESTSFDLRAAYDIYGIAIGYIAKSKC